MTNKVVLVPMDKAEISQNDVIKSTCTIEIAVRDFVSLDWQPQQLLIVSDEIATHGDYIAMTKQVYKIAKSCILLDEFKEKKIIAAYPAISGIPTIELSDIQEMERRGWPESVELRTWEFAKGQHKQLPYGDSIVINWEPTETKPEIVKSKVMTAEQWQYATNRTVSSAIWKDLTEYAEYYHKAMTEQANKQARNEPQVSYSEWYKGKYLEFQASTKIADYTREVLRETGASETLREATPQTDEHKVLCINDIGNMGITEGKLYDVIDETEKCLIIMNDDGERANYARFRFR